MSDNTIYLQAHKVLDMSLITSKMHLPPLPVHSLKVLRSICCLAALSLSVLSIGFYVRKCWDPVLVIIIGTFAILGVEVHK